MDEKIFWELFSRHAPTKKTTFSKCHLLSFIFGLLKQFITIFTTNIHEKYTYSIPRVPGFEPTTFGAWVSPHKLFLQNISWSQEQWSSWSLEMLQLLKLSMLTRRGMIFVTLLLCIVVLNQREWERERERERENKWKNCCQNNFPPINMFFRLMAFQANWVSIMVYLIVIIEQEQYETNRSSFDQFVVSDNDDLPKSFLIRALVASITFLSNCLILYNGDSRPLFLYFRLFNTVHNR